MRRSTAEFIFLFNIRRGTSCVIILIFLLSISGSGSCILNDYYFIHCIRKLQKMGNEDERGQTVEYGSGENEVLTEHTSAPSILVLSDIIWPSMGSIFQKNFSATKSLDECVKIINFMERRTFNLQQLFSNCAKK